MRRLVYAPYVQAFIKSDFGVVDISPYITAGAVDRKVNQVSSAQLTIRNPVKGGSDNLIWTEHDYTDSTGKKQVGPMFHPMDPIIIVMTRLPGHEIQVFTGYVDKAPYIQLFPGLCTIEASCTLKRLLYTQWDAALPFVQYFLQQFGWQLNGDSGLVNPSAETQRVKGYAGQLQGQFNDGSIGALLFAVLNVIGAWDESTIWIEALPPVIKDILVRLYHEIQGEVDQGEQLFEGLIHQILGSSGQGNGSPTGSGAGGTVGSPLLNSNQQKFGTAFSGATGLDPNVVTAWLLLEEPASASQAPNGANNWLNIGDTGTGNFGGSAAVWNDPQTAGAFTAQWMSGASLPGYGVASGGIQAIIKTAGQSPQTQIRAIQSSGWAASGYPILPQKYAEVVKAGGNSAAPSSSTNSNNSSTAPNPGSHLATQSMPAVKGGRSPGGKTGSATPNTGGSYFATIFPPGTKGVLERTDMGVDFSFPDGVQIGAIASGTVSLTTSTRFANQPLLMVLLDTPIDGYKAWYISEGILPKKTSGHVNAGDQIAVTQSHGTGIETGWADPNTGYPVADPYYHEGDQTADGKAFATTIGVPILASGQSQPITVSGSPMSGGGGSTGGGSSSGTSATAAAFSTFINLPSIFQSAEALAFTGKRSFIADQPLFPFIEQLCQASLRNFMSMPNGNFFAFFPDYFGLFGRKAYWEIEDIEIIDARIDLSDDPLVTHIAVAGDVTQFHGTVDVFDLIQTSGIFTIFDAIATGYIGTDPVQDLDLFTAQGAAKIPSGKKQELKGRQAALAFLQKYGARPYVEEDPMIRSPFFELFLAFQKFLLLWSKQFQTTIEITFMPELFPGGLVALPQHHLQLYIEEVTHNFDYTQGFTTTVNVSSPSRLSDRSRPNISEGMARDAVLTSSTNS